jgi:hypothetical protein
MEPSWSPVVATGDNRSQIETPRMKKIEPTRKTIPSTLDPTSSTNPGNGPTRKHGDPIAKRKPIHQVARRDAHYTLSCSVSGYCPRT